MIRINPLGLGLALAFTAAVLSLACAGLVAIAPEQTLAVFQSWWHGLDVSSLARTAPPLTLRSVLVGLVSITAAAFVVGFVFALVNNLVLRLLSGATSRTA